MIYQDIHSILIESSNRFGSKEYIISVDQKKRITFEQIEKYTGKVANFLKDKGLRKEDRVSLIGKNTIETIIIFLGVMRYGAVLNPINKEESSENILKIIRRVKPRALICDEEVDASEFGDAELCMPFAELETTDTQQFNLFTAINTQPEFFKKPIGAREDIAEILFTSGTTEQPKGVVISREELFFMVDEVIRKIGLTQTDRMLEYRAYSWASTQLLSILSTLRVGATLVLARKFSRSRFPDWLKEHNVTISSGVPTVINILVSKPVKLHQKDVPNLRYITSSSAPLSVDKQRTFEKIYGIRVNQMAGMTEAGWMIGNPPQKGKTGSVGTPFAHKQVVILDEEGHECTVGQEGEIAIKGKSLAMGYLNEEGGIDSFSKDGFRTGDIGYMDSEGYIFISGRKKDLIIRGGVNISPKEITDRIQQHPAVKEVVTLGIPDAIYGEQVACFVVPLKKGELNSNDLRQHCSKTLPDFKVPKIIRFLDQIPKSERGKVSKNILIEMLSKEETV